jgi:hypothetical protein
MMQPTIIPIYPPEAIQRMAKERPDVRSPVTIEHTLVPCPSCGTDGWIGPKQRVAAVLGAGTVLCVLCMVKDPELMGAAWEYRSLNPGIEDVPRRNG